jgi:type III pantothenate kinase
LANGVVQDFPTDTHAAISSGVAAAQAGALVRQWVVAIRRYGDVPVIYVSGGGWQKIADESHRLLAEAAALMDRLPPLLTVLEYPVLEGLAYLAAELDH